MLSPFENPLDTEIHCTEIVDWVVKNYVLLTGEYTPVAFLDEKWFYRVNRRRKIKYLSCSKGDNEFPVQRTRHFL